MSKMLGLQLKHAQRCPVCGRIPKTKRKAFGKTVIQCKSLLGKTHMRVEVNSFGFFGQRSKAIQAWNDTINSSNNYELRKVVSVGGLNKI